MAPVTNGKLIFNEIPLGYPVPGNTTIYDASQQIDLDSVPLNGGFLLKILSVSVDPFQRPRMVDPKNYAAAYKLGGPVSNFGIALVLRSETPKIPVGAHVYGWLNYQHYEVRDDPSAFRVIENKENLPWTAYLGVLGMAGKTADFGWKELSAAKEGDIAFVTAGAGSVGQLVIQLAKLEGLKVIASAGSDEKVEYLKTLGADVAFNYKTNKTADVLEREGPIDVFWDNVGGETLEAAIENAAVGARFIECGMISTYNATGEPYNVKNLGLVVRKQLRISGFIWRSFIQKYEEDFYATLPAKIASGVIKYREDRTIGLEEAGQAIVDVLTGASNGKKVVIIGEE